MSKTKIALLVMSLLASPATLAWSAERATPDDTARFLAGLPPSTKSPLAPLAKEPAWQRHAGYFTTIFSRVERDRLSKIPAFSAAQMSAPQETMFYMFGGPDALHAVTFFPNASIYVLSGLEPIGDIPQLSGASRGTVERTLRNIKSSLGTLMTYSFFKTKDMRHQLQAGPVQGALPIIYVFLARSGKTVEETSLVTLDRDGNEMPADQPRVKGSTPGVKIAFTNQEGRHQTLYYFSTNLDNDGVKSSGFLAFCAKLGTGDALLKSASYLMHGNNFSSVRSFILDNSKTILQDDSGIPVSFFDRSKWRLQAFGRYVGPISIFSHRYQPQLAQLFRSGQPVHLDFGIGYRWHNNKSNLLLAQRIADRRAD